MESNGDETEQQTPAATQSSPKCGSCGEPGHAVIQCFKTRDGLIFGCACCNSADHETAQCADFPEDIKDQIDMVVRKRGYMPPLATPPWFPILYEAVHDGLTKAHMGPLPWTPEFAEKNATCHNYRFDPQTKDWDSAKAFHRSAEVVLHVLLYAADRDERAALADGRSILSDMRPSRTVKSPNNARRRALVCSAFDALEMVWKTQTPVAVGDQVEA